AGVVENTWIRDERSKWRPDRAGFGINGRFRSLPKKGVERNRIARPKQVVAAGVVNSDRVVDRFNYECIPYREALVWRLKFTIDAVWPGKSQICLLKFAQPKETREVSADNGVARRSRDMSSPHARRTVAAVCSRNIKIFINLETLPEE